MEAAGERDRWRVAEEWLSRMVQDAGVYKARGLLEKVPWGLRLWSLVGHDRETRVGYLAGLLSNDWLGERHINSIASYLNARAQKESGSRPKSLVTGLDFYTYLSHNSGETAEVIRTHDGLSAYAKQISDHNYQRVFIPAHVGGNHWMVFSVDFEKCEFKYGEFA